MLATLAMLRRDPALSIALAGFGATQNPSIAGLIPAACVYWGLLALRPAWALWPAAQRSATRNTMLALAGVLLGALPYLHNQVVFGMPSIIAVYFTNPDLISWERFSSLFLDLNQGLIAGFPGLLLALALLPALLDKPFRFCWFAYAAGAACLALGMAFPALATVNWNSGYSVVLRYAYWAAMPVVAVCIVGLTHLSAGRRWTVLACVVVCQALAIWQAGGHTGRGYLTHTRLADWVLDHAPHWYNPDPEVFLERETKKEQGLVKTLVIVHHGASGPTKMMRYWSNTADSGGVCAQDQVILSAGVRTVSGWEYFNARSSVVMQNDKAAREIIVNPAPLIVDLDGTLIHTDMLHESALQVLRASPADVLRIPLWLLQGKAVLKSELTRRGSFDPALLPYNEPLLAWLKEARAAGRRIVLCTASDHSIAQAVAGHLGVFDEVLASDGDVNLAGDRKAEVLRRRFGHGGFDYAGNSSADLRVWQRARKAITVNGSPGLARMAAALCGVEREFPAPRRGIAAWRKALRVHQWLKNILLFVPLVAAHRVDQVNDWLTLLLAFASFSLCASTVYIANDLLDLESDRAHPRKRLRPFASGLVPAWQGVALAPLLLAASLGLGAMVGGTFLPWLSFYFVLTCVYSWGLKQVMLLDCLTLAMLYTLRITAGAAALGIQLSFWLLAFSVFLFLSLAFVKRYAELQMQALHGKDKVHGRGYYTGDSALVMNLGVVAGHASAVVLALYLNSAAVMVLYKRPEPVWGTVPVLLFWVSWIWMQAHRGQMHDDPIVFAVKDRASQLAGLAFWAALLGGTHGWS